MRRRAVRVRSAPSRAARHPLPYPEAPAEIRQAPQPAFTCRDMDATDLYGRVHVGIWAQSRARYSAAIMSKSCRHAYVASISGRAAAQSSEVRTGRIGAGTGIITGRNRYRNRERVRFRHNCPNPPFGRETHVDGAWLGPGAFGRATRDLFPRSNDTGRRINRHGAEKSALGGERITPRTAHNARCRRQADIAQWRAGPRSCGKRAYALRPREGPQSARSGQSVGSGPHAS